MSLTPYLNLDPEYIGNQPKDIGQKAKKWDKVRVEEEEEEAEERRPKKTTKGNLYF
jgi:hypothetical protein